MSLLMGIYFFSFVIYCYQLISLKIVLYLEGYVLNIGFLWLKCVYSFVARLMYCQRIQQCSFLFVCFLINRKRKQLFLFIAINQQCYFEIFCQSNREQLVLNYCSMLPLDWRSPKSLPPSRFGDSVGGLRTQHIVVLIGLIYYSERR